VFCPDKEKHGAWLGFHRRIQKDKRLDRLLFLRIFLLHFTRNWPAMEISSG